MAGGQLSKSSDGLSLSGPRSGSRSVHLSGSSFLDHTANRSSSLLPNTNTPSILNLLVFESSREGHGLAALPALLPLLFPHFSGGSWSSLCKAILPASLQTLCTSWSCALRMEAFDQDWHLSEKCSLSQRRTMMTKNVFLMFQTYDHYY